MNIFSGSRRIAIVAGTLWVVGWAVAAALHETKIYARYDIVGDVKNATFVGFNHNSCPQKTNEHSLKLNTKAGHPINVMLCISGSVIYVPEGFLLDNQKLLLQDPGYINSDLETKKRLFAIHVAQSPDYMAANLATKKTIRSKFGIPEIDEKPFDPDAYLAGKKAEDELNARRRLAELETKTADQPAPAKSFNNSFKLNEEEDTRLNQKWWESWRSAYGQGLAVMLGGLIALWIFSLAMGWIVRGFLGIPLQRDTRS
jgi:hypothetical protein